MPLPVSDANAQWPPKELEQILPRMAQWSAWWSNSLERLQAAYGGGQSMDSIGFFASDTGGFKAAVGRTLQRWFVGQRPLGPERNTKLPSPIASGICQASADLMFSDPITVTVTDKGTQARVEELLDDNFHSTIAEAAEAGAALGGVYLRATWDDSVVDDAPFTTTIDADQAIPEFKWGRLVAVTFWSVIAREGKVVTRHLERHELDAFGVGIILHGLYEGTEDKLGVRVSLTTNSMTEPMAAHIDLNIEGSISTLTPDLAVEYIPNQTPNRGWRHHPVGKNLGRSDLDGIEHLLDQHAETMSDWMRARRAARARVMMSKELVKSAGPGNGQVVDLDQETYVETSFSMGGGPSSTPTLADRVQVLQPTFNPEQYKATADALFDQIIQTAGYSMETFGIDNGAAQRTATEIESKERRSLMTRSRKIREWRPGLERHLAKLLAIDNAFFNGHNNPAGLVVEFSDGVQESQLKLAQTAQALYTAESASAHERVAMLHPDWDEKQIDAEVALIKDEFDHTMSEPIPFGGDLPPEPPEDALNGSTVS